MTTTSTAPAPAVSDTDKAAVVSVPSRIVAAWASHNAKAFAAVFTPDGTMILPGAFSKGTADIEAFMTAAFAGPYKGTQVTGLPIDMRFLNSETALVITQGGVLAPGENKVHPDRAVRATWVVAKHEGEWKLAAYQNSPLGA
ncbi:SgcJ/EcaC family oxidoreductase [Sphaerisporangium dianthi]|uniref:SgcJ/EcaC family oxidoreductase n=1 Tax=Sphaerisporangium dianthi TaxID=1436120 RepID=A0ABV9CJT5_9ACTN